MNTLRFILTLSFSQQIRWVAHFIKSHWKHKERRRALALASHVAAGGVIYDIGAHFGYLTKEFATAHNGDIRVIAFEPSPYCLSILHLNVRSLKNVLVVAIALGSQMKEGVLKTPLKRKGLLGIGRAQLDGTIDRPHKTQKVEVLTLDEYCARNDVPPPHLLKVDVEGGELDIIKGANNLIKAHHPIWYLEIVEAYTANYGYTPQDLFALMFEYGYKAYKMDADGNLHATPHYDGIADYFFKV